MCMTRKFNKTVLTVTTTDYMNYTLQGKYIYFLSSLYSSGSSFSEEMKADESNSIQFFFYDPLMCLPITLRYCKEILAVYLSFREVEIKIIYSRGPSDVNQVVIRRVRSRFLEIWKHLTQLYNWQIEPHACK